VRKFASHKVVEAAKITHFEEPAHLVVHSDEVGKGAVVDVPESTFARYKPVPGDYLVRYADGYLSISPAKAFEEGYRELGPGLSFSQALEHVKLGARVARRGWNGKGMFIFLVPGSTFKVNRPPLLGIYPEGTEVRYHGHVDMKTADGQVVPWLASQTDLLAEDWELVEAPAA
jgi:hypothetical protein